ncbi:helix-turn-helix domain-containing protein [Paenibacillus qinlingensis]|uniref:YesN/AraC family two-component response regulator n=1 Tax=Paenibacillus qinlingensis TaxID=1837343 RepID=A0ABU1P1N5_9BACL|nr:helix-turn-helix domain-containing protein [Paenibacillus qinlingensis]MDR6553012.1 YesN/AraC family two-component response regulator [Paenibacillus qinlingensis]
MMLRNQESKFMYRNILLSIVLSIVITLLVSSTILYVNFDNIALQQVYESDSNSLLQTSQEIRTITETATSLSFQIYRDFVISKLLFYDKPDIYDVQGSMSQLNLYRLAMPFIESIYVYNGKSELFYVSSNNFQSGIQTKATLGDPSMIDILDHFQNYIPFLPIPRYFKANGPNSLESTSIGIYSYLCYDAINLNNSLNSAVVVNISESFFNKSLKNVANNRASNEIIINKEGTLISTDGTNPILSNYADKGYIQQIIANPSSPGYLVDQVNGTKSLVSYTAPDSLGWRYVRTTPYTIITEEIRDMRLKTIYISLTILLVGLLISLIMSKRLFDPIDKVIRSLKTLEIEKRDNLQILRQNFLRNIIMGRDAYHPQALQSKLTYFGSNITIGHPSLLLMVKMDRYEENIRTYKDQLTLLRYAVMNICTEISSTTYHAEGVDMGDDHIILILSAKEADFIWECSAFAELLQNMQASIASFIKLSVSITVSPLQDDANQSFQLYKQLLEASYHRLFRGHGCIISSEEIIAYRTKEYKFPSQKERQLVDCLMTGDSEEAERIYTEIIYETSLYPYTVVHLAISHLTLTVNNVLTTINKNNALAFPLYLDAAVASLTHVETIEEINGQFIDLFRQLQKKLDEKRSSKHVELIKKMNDIIDRDYANQNLSLNSIADELAMSSIYISRLYKQHTMIAITDVIQDVRMHKSKDLLLNTSLSVAEIAEKTGFTSDSYFYRLFKKYNGITPNDFRKQLKYENTLHQKGIEER